MNYQKRLNAMEELKIWDDFKPLSSSMDWCESNYSTHSLIAEFWNTVSNILFFIIPPILIYLFKPYQKQVCRSVHVVWFFLIMVGIGSVWFHSTLSVMGQLMDEIAILWVNMAALAVWLPTKYLPQSLQKNRWVFQTGIYTASVIITFLTYMKPEINHMMLFCFGFPAISWLVAEMKICECPRVVRCGKISASWFAAAVACWLSDRFMCRMWTEVLNFPYLHGIWHIMVCLASYLVCVCYAYFYASYEAPEKDPTLRYWPYDTNTWFGIPYVHVISPEEKPPKWQI